MATPADSEKPTAQTPDEGKGSGLKQLEPMDFDIAKVVLIGTVLYAIAAVVLLPMHSSLTHDGHGRWPWIAVSGVGLGLLGLYYLRHLKRRAAAREAAEKAAG